MSFFRIHDSQASMQVRESMAQDCRESMFLGVRGSVAQSFADQEAPTPDSPPDPPPDPPPEPPVLPPPDPSLPTPNPAQVPAGLTCFRTRE